MAAPSSFAAFIFYTGLLLSFFLLLLGITFTFTLLFARRHIARIRSKTRSRLLESVKLEGGQAGQREPVVLGLFHPYCNAGGGGERVLWCCVRDVLAAYPYVVCAIYTGDTDATKDQIISRAKERFNIELDTDRIVFVFLQGRKWVEDKRYPRFTLLGQALGSMVLGWEALNLLVPDIYFDTMGYSFTYPLVKLLCGCPVASYVHYPTISSDMLRRISGRVSAHNNQSHISRNPVLSRAKLIYYHAFAALYTFFGSHSDAVMVNSSWTKSHIDSLWHTNAQIVYPPCDTERLRRIKLEGEEREEGIIVSVAQFRPEKDHPLQLRAISELVKRYPAYREKGLKLVLVGSARNAGDEERIEALKALATELNIIDLVHFEVNAPYEKLLHWLARGQIGIHTMWNEHFGIGVVEYMAAGLIPVVHNSGGPKLDIVVEWKGERTGYLAETAEEFAMALHTVLSMPEQERWRMRERGRESVVKKFSEEQFVDGILESLDAFLTR
ncbi:uncharacterized protein VTP21DRAFT_5016 [Calcarisporiella thermophila]|uniref:uncharacterized protein n=1 Tax=Calcarisporiella thermophila TaxID=911321 RepID=UPI003742B27C